MVGLAEPGFDGCCSQYLLFAQGSSESSDNMHCASDGTNTHLPGNKKCPSVYLGRCPLTIWSVSGFDRLWLEWDINGFTGSLGRKQGYLLSDLCQFNEQVRAATGLWPTGIHIKGHLEPTAIFIPFCSPPAAHHVRRQSDRSVL
jgi:hypothetical protein